MLSFTVASVTLFLLKQKARVILANRCPRFRRHSTPRGKAEVIRYGTDAHPEDQGHERRYCAGTNANALEQCLRQQLRGSAESTPLPRYVSA
ncbi:hypothetical protein PC119_g1330 [Phytophthora cactorum]|nr:hypothetical protein PC119_g1330 [Phytophthora cactorum]